MFDAASLLGSLMDNALSKNASGRVQQGIQSAGPGGLLGDLLSGAGQGAKTGLGDIAGALFGGKGQGFDLGKAGLGALAGSLLGGGGDSVKGALGGAAVALLGQLAYQALQQRAGGGAAPQAAMGLGGMAGGAQPQDVQQVALLTLRAMINAAKADGEIDDQELQRILGKVREGGGDAEAQEFVIREMRKPLDIDGLVRDAKTPQLAAQLYAASLFAIEVDTPAEQEYLRMLAARLGLERQVVESLHHALGVSGV